MSEPDATRPLDDPSAAFDRSELHTPATFGSRAADLMARVVGSWRFIIGQTVVQSVWMGWNLCAPHALKWDPPPFILLNLLLSTEAGYTGSILQKASNRQAAINQSRDDKEAREVSLMYAILLQNTKLTAQIHALAEQNAQTIALVQRHIERTAPLAPPPVAPVPPPLAHVPVHLPESVIPSAAPDQL